MKRLSIPNCDMEEIDNKDKQKIRSDETSYAGNSKDRSKTGNAPKQEFDKKQEFNYKQEAEEDFLEVKKKDMGSVKRESLLIKTKSIDNSHSNNDFGKADNVKKAISSEKKVDIEENHSTNFIFAENSDSIGDNSDCIPDDALNKVGNVYINKPRQSQLQKVLESKYFPTLPKIKKAISKKAHFQDIGGLNHISEQVDFANQNAIEEDDKYDRKNVLNLEEIAEKKFYNKNTEEKPDQEDSESDKGQEDYESDEGQEDYESDEGKKDYESAVGQEDDNEDHNTTEGNLDEDFAQIDYKKFIDTICEVYEFLMDELELDKEDPIDINKDKKLDYKIPEDSDNIQNEQLNESRTELATKNKEEHGIEFGNEDSPVYNDGDDKTEHQFAEPSKFLDVKTESLLKESTSKPLSKIINSPRQQTKMAKLIKKNSLANLKQYFVFKSNHPDTQAKNEITEDQDKSYNDTDDAINSFQKSVEQTNKFMDLIKYLTQNIPIAFMNKNIKTTFEYLLKSNSEQIPSLKNNFDNKNDQNSSKSSDDNSDEDNKTENDQNMPSMSNCSMQITPQIMLTISLERIIDIWFSSQKLAILVTKKPLLKRIKGWFTLTKKAPIFLKVKKKLLEFIQACLSLRALSPSLKINRKSGNPIVNLLFQFEYFQIDVFLMNLVELVTHNKHHTAFNSFYKTKTLEQKLVDLSQSIFNTVLSEILEKCREIGTDKNIKNNSYQAIIVISKSDNMKNWCLIIIDRLLKAAKEDFYAYHQRPPTGILKSNISQYLLSIYLCLLIWPTFDAKLQESLYYWDLIDILNICIDECYLKYPKSQIGFIAITLLQKLCSYKSLNESFNTLMKKSVNLEFGPLIIGNYCDLILSNFLFILQDSITNNSIFYLKNCIAIIKNISIIPRVLTKKTSAYFQGLLQLLKVKENICKRIEYQILYIEILEVLEYLFVISFSTGNDFIINILTNLDDILNMEDLKITKSYLLLNSSDFSDFKKQNIIQLDNSIKKKLKELHDYYIARIVEISLHNFKLINAYMKEQMILEPILDMGMILMKCKKGELIPVIKEPSLYVIQTGYAHNMKILILNWILIASKKFVSPALPFRQMKIVDYQKDLQFIDK